MKHEIKKLDRRVVKTKKAIRNAFAKLLSEKNINDITIQDIADTADINRKTFYNYYSNIYQIVDEIENEIVTAFATAIQNVDFNRDMKEPYVIFSKLTTIINSDIDFYAHLLKLDSNFSLFSKIITALKDKAKESFSSQIVIEDSKLEFMVDYIAAGMIAVYQIWFNSGRKIAIETLAEQASVMTFCGVKGMLGIK